MPGPSLSTCNAVSLFMDGASSEKCPPEPTPLPTRMGVKRSRFQSKRVDGRCDQDVDISQFRRCQWKTVEALLAEGVGFEPTRERNPLPVFKTGALNHSATLPWLESPAARHITDGA